MQTHLGEVAFAFVDFAAHRSFVVIVGCGASEDLPQAISRNATKDLALFSHTGDGGKIAFGIGFAEGAFGLQTAELGEGAVTGTLGGDTSPLNADVARVGEAVILGGRGGLVGG